VLTSVGGDEMVSDLMPEDLPPHPRVFVSGEQLDRCRSLTERTDWGRAALKRLLDAAATHPRVEGSLQPGQGSEILNHAFRQVLAFHLTGRRAYFEQALSAYRETTRAYLEWPLVDGFLRAAPYGLSESRFTLTLGRVYDLLAAVGLSDPDTALFLEALAFTRETTDRCQHTTCGNHNTWNLVARISAGLASGNLGFVADALDGWSAHGRTYYGLVHQLRHDILSDGLHWERTPGYHFYTLMAFTEAVAMLSYAGVDLWRADLPAQQADDGDDLHRAYGPDGLKCFKAAFDAPFYLTLGEGELSLLQDSGLANLRGVWIWGPLYELAYEAYGDPKYAWLLSRVEQEYRGRPERKYPELPMSLQTNAGEYDFVRLGEIDYPDGRFDLGEDCSISLSGVHKAGSTLFPVTGVTVLRTRPDDADGSAAQVFWGPHSAGHQSPAALHLDLYLQGRCVTTAPRSGGYEDPIHLTWFRTTIAHNTVTVDERPMFPYDQGGESIWEADNRRNHPSDGVLELFQPGDRFQVCRASNEAVYPGVRLDRTVILADGYAIDLFRVIGSVPHSYDYATHVLGTPVVPDTGEAATLGTGLGYRHLGNPRSLVALEAMISLAWDTPDGAIQARMAVPEGSEPVLAEDPVPAEGHELGELESGPRPHSVIIRARGESAVFASIWGPGGNSLELAVDRGQPDGDVVLKTVVGSEAARWQIPWRAEPVTCEGQ
jgi:hypothetical protein